LLQNSVINTEVVAMSAVALVREIIVNGKRVRQTLNLGRGRRPKNLAAGSFYLRYFCPTKGKRVNEHVGYDFNAAVAMREAREREINARKHAEANGLKVELPAAADQNRLKVNDAIDLYFRNLCALGKDPKTIRAYRKSVDQFRESCTKQYMDAIGKQDLIDFMGWLRLQPQRRQRNANPGRTHFNKVNNVIIFLAAFEIRKILKKNEYPKFTGKPVIYFDDQQLKRLFASCMNAEEELTLDFFLQLGVRDGEAAHAEYSHIAVDGNDVVAPLLGELAEVAKLSFNMLFWGGDTGIQGTFFHRRCSFALFSRAGDGSIMGRSPAISSRAA